MNLTKVTYSVLREEGIDLGKLGDAVNSACAKREVSKETYSQSGKAFSRSETSKIGRNSLTDIEDFALTVVAYDTHMAKAAKTWGLETWPVPVAMLETCKHLFPYRKVTETVPA